MEYDLEDEDRMDVLRIRYILFYTREDMDRIFTQLSHKPGDIRAGHLSNYFMMPTMLWKYR
jgi:hypothetical protein